MQKPHKTIWAILLIPLLSACSDATEDLISREYVSDELKFRKKNQLIMACGMAYSALGRDHDIAHSERTEFMRKGGHYIALASGLSSYHSCKNLMLAANTYCVVSSMGDHVLRTSKIAQDEHIQSCKKKYTKNIDKSAFGECLDKSDLHTRLYIKDGADLISNQWSNRAEIISKNSSIEFQNAFKSTVADICL